MCLAVPGKIIKIEEDKAVVEYDGSLKNVDLSMIDAAVGDYIIANAGFAVQKIEKKSALEAIRLFQEIPELD